MLSHDAQVAVAQGLGILMVVPAAGLVVAVGTSVWDRVRGRRTAQGVEERGPVLLARVPAQRRGGEPR
jgi:hypothetical protein